MTSNTQGKKSPYSDSAYYEQGRLDALVEILSYSYDELFDALGISLSKTSKMYIGCCPIHGGDNAGALNLYTDGYAVKGFWKCRTHHCEKVFKKTLIGFIRGTLSHTKKNWSRESDKDKMFSFKETIDWICNFLKQDIKDIKVNTEDISNKKFVAQIASMVKQKLEIKGISKKQVRQTLEIPSKFFLEKGYSEKILDDYDVGLCNNPTKEMYDRVVVPVYGEDKNIMVCCTGRSIHPICNSCSYYHKPKIECPDKNDKYAGLKYSKWRNSSNSNVSSHLYNYWLAKKFIKETGTIIIVEGPADIWKLEELGIHNAVALFGVEMSDEQQVLIEMCGALNVVILLDMDDAGRKAVREIKKRLERSYRVYIPEISVNDPGDYNNLIVEQELLPILKSIQR